MKIKWKIHASDCIYCNALVTTDEFKTSHYNNLRIKLTSFLRQSFALNSQLFVRLMFSEQGIRHLLIQLKRNNELHDYPVVSRPNRPKFLPRKSSCVFQIKCLKAYLSSTHFRIEFIERKRVYKANWFSCRYDLQEKDSVKSLKAARPKNDLVAAWYDNVHAWLTLLLIIQSNRHIRQMHNCIQIKCHIKLYPTRGRFSNNSQIDSLISKRLSVENKAKLYQLETQNTSSAVLLILNFQLREFRFVLCQWRKLGKISGGLKY